MKRSGERFRVPEEIKMTIRTLVEAGFDRREVATQIGWSLNAIYKIAPAGRPECRRKRIGSNRFAQYLVHRGAGL